MDGKISQQDIVKRLAEKHSMDIKDTEVFVNGMFALIEEALVTDSIVKIKGLGTFKLVDVENRESINVNTGERFQIKEHSKISFTPDSALKEHINKPFSHFETVVLNENTNFDDMPSTIDDNVVNNTSESSSNGINDNSLEVHTETSQINTDDNIIEQKEDQGVIENYTEEYNIDAEHKKDNIEQTEEYSGGNEKDIDKVSDANISVDTDSDNVEESTSVEDIKEVRKEDIDSDVEKSNINEEIGIGTKNTEIDASQEEPSSTDKNEFIENEIPLDDDISLSDESINLSESDSGNEASSTINQTNDELVNNIATDANTTLPEESVISSEPIEKEANEINATYSKDTILKGNPEHFSTASRINKKKKKNSKNTIMIAACALIVIIAAISISLLLFIDSSNSSDVKDNSFSLPDKQAYKASVEQTKEPSGSTNSQNAVVDDEFKNVEKEIKGGEANVNSEAEKVAKKEIVNDGRVESSIPAKVNETSTATSKIKDDVKNVTSQTSKKEANQVSNQSQKKEVKDSQVTKPTKEVDNNKTITEKNNTSAYDENLNYKIIALKRNHKVAAGETLRTIALKYYGSKKFWNYILDYNKSTIKDMNHLKLGSTLKIPELKAQK